MVSVCPVPDSVFPKAEATHVKWGFWVTLKDKRRSGDIQECLETENGRINGQNQKYFEGTRRRDNPRSYYYDPTKEEMGGTVLLALEWGFGPVLVKGEVWMWIVLCDDCK
jgi:hypothetical protein